MKWAFIAFLFVFTPALTSWLRSNPRNRPLVWSLLGFLPFVTGAWNLDAAPIAWPYWPGHTRGLEIGLIDAVALAIILASKPRKHRLPFAGPFAAYIAAVIFAVPFGGVWLAGAFYAWQFLRVFLVFVAVVRICEDERAPLAIITGMVAGLGFHACYAAYAVAAGAVQAGGAFGHQNTLGLATHFVAYPALAVLLASKRGFAPLAGAGLGLLVAILTASRATIGLVGVGYALTIAASSARRMTPRKSAAALVALAGLAAATPLAMSSLERRYETVGRPDQGYDERAAFERTASMMLNDHPFGVGPNQYVVVANSQGYSARAGVIWNFGSRAAHVHNTYLLVAAETGYFGLITLIVLISRALWVAFRGSFRFRKDARGDVLLGFGIALLISALHGLYEWVLVLAPLQYLIGINMGVIAGMALQIGYWERRHPKPARPDAVHRLPKQIGSEMNTKPLES
jgi:O-antigen ligase